MVFEPHPGQRWWEEREPSTVETPEGLRCADPVCHIRIDLEGHSDRCKFTVRDGPRNDGTAPVALSPEARRADEGPFRGRSARTAIGAVRQAVDRWKALWVIPVLGLIAITRLLPSGGSAASRGLGAAAAVAAIAIVIGWPVEQRRRKYSRSGITDIDDMSGLAFERRLARLYRDLGYHVIETPPSGDHGADLVVWRSGGPRTCVQAKCYAGKVGRDAVAAVVSSMPHYGATRAAVVTNSGFTRGAMQTAGEWGVELVDRSTLVAHLAKVSSAPSPTGYRLLAMQFGYGLLALLVVGTGFVALALMAAMSAAAASSARSRRR